MSELLIYNRNYETIYEKGDIVEIQPDGYWTSERSFDDNAFKVISIPGVEVQDCTGPLYNAGSMIKKRIYNVDTSFLDFTDNIAEIEKLEELKIFEKEIKSYTGTYKYVRADATGSGTGDDWNNAYTDLPSELTRGTTYYVASGIYGPKIFNDAEDGTTEIIIKKATVAEHGPASDWLTDYGKGQAIFQQLDSHTGFSVFEFNEGYYTIDGLFEHGFKFYTNTSDVDAVISVIDTGWAGRIFYGITLNNLEIQHKGCDNSNGGGRGFQVHSQARVNNFSMRNCYIHDIPGICLYFVNSDDGIIENCHIARNHSDGVSHGEGIQVTGDCSNFIIRNNIWEDIEGTAAIMAGYDWKVYNNVFFYTSGYPNAGQSGDGLGMGIVALIAGALSGNCKVYHNTSYNLQGINVGFNGSEKTGNLIYNNIWANCERIRFLYCSQDYNYYLNNLDLDYGLSSNNQIDTVNIFKDIQKNDYSLTRSTDSGVDLVTDTDCNYEIDIEGTIRINKDRGAYEFQGG